MMVKTLHAIITNRTMRRTWGLDKLTSLTPLDFHGDPSYFHAFERSVHRPFFFLFFRSMRSLRVHPWVREYSFGVHVENYECDCGVNDDNEAVVFFEEEGRDEDEV